MESIYQETFFLSAGESNAEQEMSLPLLVAKIIDIATAHANALGIGNPSMTEISAGWVLVRLTVEMEEYPKVNCEYTISTWIESFNRHFSERAFKISSPDGKVYGYIRSVWMVMNIKDHSNLGLSHLTLSSKLISGEHPPIEKQAKHTLIVENHEADSSNNVLLADHPVYTYRFKYCDLDFYRHVNTVRYVSILLNRFSLKEHDECYIKRLELSFLHEAKYGMETNVLRADDNTGLLSSFLLRKAADHTPLLFARILRRPRK
ncbi:MAG: hypothetical protein K2H46_00240 [Muribaculaceae bacterium]|nr:hypothetical protein [Muribaculaceae bacterium]